MESVYHYIRGTGVRKLAKEHNKQVGSDFLETLDRQVYSMVIRAIKANGTIKRLSAGVIE